jgi:NAD-dependent dihydropyrimidine dehydrogenase PreA subunit
MAMFIRVDFENGVIQKTPGLAKKIVEVCPVNIYKLASKENTVETIEDNLDECTLCDLCMQASPDGVKVVKLYES